MMVSRKIRVLIVDDSASVRQVLSEIVSGEADMEVLGTASNPYFAAERMRDLAGGGPTPGFGGMLEGDPAAEAGAHLTEDAARRAWREGLAMSVPEAVSVVTGPR